MKRAKKKNDFQTHRLYNKRKKSHAQEKPLINIKKILIRFAGIAIILFALLVYILGPLRAYIFRIPSLAGFFGQSNYLLLFQNNYELRPTGGFISAYGTLSFTLGIPSIKIHDSYEISSESNKKAPAPLETFLSMDPKYKGYQFRDANFHPDFSESVDEILTFYKEKYPDETFDGVIAIDLYMLEKLIEVFEPISIDGETYTKNNFFLSTQRSVKNIDLHNEEALANRKNILSTIGHKLISTAILSPFSWASISDTIYDGLNTKHILLHFNNPSHQELAEKNNWAGVQNGYLYSNYIAINVANIGGRKGDRYIHKRYSYTMSFDKTGLAIAKIQLHLKHLGTYHLQSDLYQGYIRTYLPEFGRIEGVKGDYWKGLNEEFTYDQYLENGSRVIGTYVHLFPGEERTIDITYRLGIKSDQENQEIHIIKQAGTIGDLWEVALQLRTDETMINTSEDELIITDNLGKWAGPLTTDKHFKIQRLADTYPPLIVEQHFTKLNEIEIIFTEPLDTKNILMKQNYDIEDSDIKDKRHDIVKIDSVRYENKRIFLTLEGVSEQHEERYKITIRDIKDSNGNLITPNPLYITAVQRY